MTYLADCNYSKDFLTWKSEQKCFALHFWFLTCNWKLVVKYIHITLLKCRVFLSWSRSLIFGLPGVTMDSPSLKKGLDLFSRNYMYLLSHLVSIKDDFQQFEGEKKHCHIEVVF